MRFVYIYKHISMRDGCVADDTVIYIIIHTEYLHSTLSILDTPRYRSSPRSSYRKSNVSKINFSLISMNLETYFYF